MFNIWAHLSHITYKRSETRWFRKHTFPKVPSGTESSTLQWFTTSTDKKSYCSQKCKNNFQIQTWYWNHSLMCCHGNPEECPGPACLSGDQNLLTVTGFSVDKLLFVENKSRELNSHQTVVTFPRCRVSSWMISWSPLSSFDRWRSPALV